MKRISAQRSNQDPKSSLRKILYLPVRETERRGKSLKGRYMCPLLFQGWVLCTLTWCLVISSHHLKISLKLNSQISALRMLDTCKHKCWGQSHAHPIEFCLSVACHPLVCCFSRASCHHTTDTKLYCLQLCSLPLYHSCLTQKPHPTLIDVMRRHYWLPTASTLWVKLIIFSSKSPGMVGCTVDTMARRSAGDRGSMYTYMFTYNIILAVCLHNDRCSIDHRVLPHTWVNLLTNDFGRPLRPPPCCSGFWQANILDCSVTLKVRPSSGTYTCTGKSELWYITLVRNLCRTSRNK